MVIKMLKVKINNDIIEYNIDLEVVSINGNSNLDEKELFDYQNKLFDYLLEEIESGRMKEDIVHNKLLIGALKYFVEILEIKNGYTCFDGKIYKG